MASEIGDQTTTQSTTMRGSNEPIVVGATSVLASVDTSARPFDFFGLPRELRDKIYEQPVLFEYEHLPAIGELDWITKAKKLRTSLLLVRRQFRSEYAERCTGRQILCMRDHCLVRGAEAILPSPNRARFWAMEFFFITNGLYDDFEGIKDCLVSWAAPDLALRFIDLKLHFVDIPKEQTESGYVRHALYSIQAFRRVASLELCLAEVPWDIGNLGRLKELIARRDSSDDMHTVFLTPAIQVYDTGTEWGKQDDTDPDCCDTSKYSLLRSDSDGEEEDEDPSGSETDGEDDNENEYRKYEDDGDSEHDSENLASVDGHDDESYTP
jgi:hypothetical protein